MPTALGGADVASLLPYATREVLGRVHHFVAENARSARAFLKAAGFPLPIQEARISTLDENTPAAEVKGLLEPLLTGFDCVVLSEAGCPAVADPGAALVRLAHARGIRVVPLVGPSALLLALMASGMNGQSFAFHGYLPVPAAARSKRLIELEAESDRTRRTQMFIEAPYRNDALFDAIVHTCRPDTLLCIATDLTLDTEAVQTRTIAEWKSGRPQLTRRPTVFLIYRERANR
ncbi:MAG: SAM-dependent methyltransferase [Burkholderiales bacterium]